MYHYSLDAAAELCSVSKKERIYNSTTTCWTTQINNINFLSRYLLVIKYSSWTVEEYIQLIWRLEPAHIPSIAVPAVRRNWLGRQSNQTAVIHRTAEKYQNFIIFMLDLAFHFQSLSSCSNFSGCLLISSYPPHKNTRRILHVKYSHTDQRQLLQKRHQ